MQTHKCQCVESMIKKLRGVGASLVLSAVTIKLKIKRKTIAGANKGRAGITTTLVTVYVAHHLGTDKNTHLHGLGCVSPLYFSPHYLLLDTCLFFNPSLRSSLSSPLFPSSSSPSSSVAGLPSPLLPSPSFIGSGECCVCFVLLK